jgi:uncharacterized protein involved in exopolysaccharide biosynthesis
MLEQIAPGIRFVAGHLGMISNHAPAICPTQVFRTLNAHWRRWLLPTVGIALLSGGYLLFRSPWWEASQALVIRNEAAHNEQGPGRFRQLDDMKVTQDTVLELAKSSSVLSAALAEVGPPGGAPDSTWPTVADVSDLRELVALSPPKGAEFGKTEIFYLKIKDHDRARAERLVSAVARHLQAGLQSLRRDKAQSMIDELDHSARLAEADLARSIERLAKLEAQIGSDLGELRMLDLSATGDSDLRRKLVAIDEEIRQTQTSKQSNQELHALLVAARQDPSQLLATPNRLLESQPALRRLKDGLIDAQLRTSQLLGAMKADHPQAASARLAESQIRQQLHAELEAAARGVEVEQRLAASRLQMLLDERAQLSSRLNKVAGLRAEYSSLTSDMKHRTALVEAAHRELAEARASQAGATTSLITLVDRPETGDRPVGPSAAAILLAGLFGGLLCGLALVFLTAPAAQIDSAKQSAITGGTHPSGRGLSLSETLAKVAAL